MNNNTVSGYHYPRMALKLFMLYTINVRLCAFVCCIAILLLLSGFSAFAQSLGDPIINITFGSGTNVYAGPLSADSGSTTYSYSNGIPNDGEYTIVNTNVGMYGTWWVTTDHTSDPGGYMMVVNASHGPGVFYTRKVVALCGNTEYQFAAWVKNLVDDDEVKPNITFSIETIGGQVLGTGTTGDIPTANQWVQYPFTFTTPANSGTLVLKMVNNVNNAPGGYGNDVAIDDITFRPYGAPVAVTFDQAAVAQTFCEGTSHIININATTTLVNGYAQKLQMLVNGVWTDQGPASTSSSFSVSSPTVVGVYSYRIVSALAGNINSTNCVVASNLLTLTVAPLPAAAFIAPSVTCLGDTVNFKDVSTSSNSMVKAWQWDFGDATTSTEQNPKHLYTLAGDHTVKLTVSNANGCTSAVSSQTIHLRPHPATAFGVSSPDCVTRAVTLTDQSVSTEGTIVSWLWDYGDGSPAETKTDAQPFQHAYATAGTYPVTLVITTDQNCTGRKVANITINPLPKVNFGVPAICLGDFYANFTDSTTITDNTASGFTYLWNFGDNKANTTYPNTSTAKNPQHHYSDTGRYAVNLTVTSNNGCAVTATKILTVNGPVHVASIAVLDPTSLCSGHEVYFENRSQVDFGNITRVKIYYDFDGDTSISVTDNDPYYGKLYKHTYPGFHTPSVKPFRIYMKAYSGTLCEADTTKLITLKATPAITISAPTAICQADGTVQFTATKTDGPDGTGVYSGTGISSSGLFDPAVSGTGIFTIQYVYTPANACADTIKHYITVDTSTTANAGPDLIVLAGGKTRLQASTNNNGLTYKWTPATGLDHPDILNPVVAPTANTTYTLTVTNSAGCTATDDVSVTILKAPLITNVFTPNGDSKNDTWAILYLDTYPGCTVDVFNRNGQKVYWSVGYTRPWDGRYNGVDLPAGTYYYMIDPKNGRSILSGSISIVR